MSTVSKTVLHPVIAGVTERIRARSIASRAAYLEKCQSMRRKGTQRGQLSCSNLAHGFAACSGEDKDRISDDPRFPFGMPRPDNGNYVWMQILWSDLNHAGRGGFVMANSASDARGSEMEIRKKIVEDGGVDGGFPVPDCHRVA